MEISAEKIKVMVNSNATSIHANITLYRNTLDEVNKVCYIDVSPSKQMDTEIM